MGYVQFSPTQRILTLRKSMIFKLQQGIPNSLSFLRNSSCPIQGPVSKNIFMWACSNIWSQKYSPPGHLCPCCLAIYLEKYKNTAGEAIPVHKINSQTQNPSHDHENSFNCRHNCHLLLTIITMCSGKLYNFYASKWTYMSNFMFLLNWKQDKFILEGKKSNKKKIFHVQKFLSFLFFPNNCIAF